MPQFEIKHTDSDHPIVKIRARTLDEAVRAHFGLDGKTPISIESGPAFRALEGWHYVHVDGQVLGQIREFHRMKFRRA